MALLRAILLRILLLLHDLHLEASHLRLALYQVVGGFLEPAGAQLVTTSGIGVLLIAVSFKLNLSPNNLAIIFNLLKNQTISLR